MSENLVINNRDITMDLEPKPNQSVAINKTVLQDIIGSVNQPEDLSEPSDINSNQAIAERTNEDDNTEQTNSKTSRELKLLLALSKEANLDTNISHKRKTLEGKSKDKAPSPKIITPESEIKKVTKVAHENRNIRYPVTAESELELDIHDNQIKNVAENSTKTPKRKRDGLSEVNAGGATEEAAKRNRKSLSNEIIMFKANKDMFCWRCHREGVNIACETCPRSYHQKCLKQTIHDVDHWPCPECVAILKAESTQTRSEAMKGMTLEHLCSLLKFAVNRMIQCQGSEPFLHPVSDSEFPSYKKYIVQPMDLTKLEKNIKENLYGSTQAFEADAKWLLHNSIIFNSYQSKLTTAAKNIVKICKQEMAEIENCPSCYLNANTKKATWFVEVCPKPHLLVWAKLKGFPYWPAKAMCTNSSGMVDVRFFGAHDRAWVHYKECYLFSEKDPNTFKQKRYDIEKCVEELNVYIQNLRKVYGEFRYAPYRTMIEPHNEFKQLQIFLPKYRLNMPLKKRVSTKAETKMMPEEKKETNIKIPSSNKESVAKIAPEEKLNKSQNGLASGSENLQDKLDIKENIPQAKVDDPDVNPAEAETVTNGVPQFQDDSIMEGYGTDDDTNSEIDLERRKTFIEGKPEIPAEKIEDEEDEDDTQVSSNINIDDSSVNNNIRVPETPCSADGIKNLLQKVSDAENNHKRQAGEEMPHFPRKASRRNSDHSVKSDSSRVSNISDKINRVDISENMEITLGNDDIACVSISENMSSSSSESSKSGSEHSLESKKKPVQVDIENTELTISPSNKLKISDKLMKRLSDTDENVESTQKVNDVKRALMEKSPTDILIEKFKGVVEHEIIDFGQPSTSTACDDEDPEDFRENTEASSTTNLRDKIENLEDVTLEFRSTTTLNEETDREIPVNKASEGLAPIEEIIQSVTEATKTMESNKFIDEPQKVICAPRGQSQSTQEKENSNRKEQDAQSQKESQTESVKQQNERNVENTIILEKENSNETQVVSKAIERGQSKEVDPRASKIEKLQPSSKELTSSADKPAFVEKSPNNTPSSTKESAEVSPEKPASNNEEAANEKDSKVANLIEEADEGEEMDTLEDIQIDKDNIFNIIHSSLNGAKAKEDNKDDPADKSSAASGKKRKLSSDENAPSQTKIVKIVPIESILKMHHKDKNGAESLILQRTLQGKKTVRRPSVSSTGSISIQNSSREIAAEEIKSEPETDEDFSESENLEAKRKYLSALNISEKVNDADKKLKANEIRTRSKTEEKKERFRIVDNMTRTIDDVALNYSASRGASSKKNESVLKEGARGSATPQEGEIYVKSFAKMQMPKQRARKSFPVPAYVKPNNSVVTSQSSLLRKDISPVTVTKKDAPKSTSSGNTNTVAAKIISSVASPATPQTPRPIESVTSSVSHLILLPPNQTINYTTSLITPVINAVPVITPTTTAITTTQIITPTLVKSKPITPNIRASQNYIPQSEDTNRSNELLATNGTLLNDLLNQPIVSTSRTEPEPVAQTESGDSTTPAIEAASDASQDNDFGVLNNLLPESVTHAVSDLLIRPPPKLKPRPPGMLSVSFDEGVPSSAGSVTSRINSVAHRMGDYFRGMLIETLEELGKSSNPEAKVVSLELEIEALKHAHNVEMSEMRKNICTILKDIQKSILEDREKIIDETRAQCEAETIKRVELAKSKQWCANCSKEAQFYCCWNTSYCDYPCQQKHWPQHLGKCTQNIEKTNNSANVPNRPVGQQLILRPAVPPKPGMGRIVAKPTKVYMNRTVTNPKTYKTLSTSGNHLTVIETTPGNYELVGNGPIAVTGKFLATTSSIFHSKFKTTNVMTMTSPSTSGTSDQRNVQKPTAVSEAAKSTTPAQSNTTTVIDDDSE